jgi:hypothetical protein
MPGADGHEVVAVDEVLNGLIPNVLLAPDQAVVMPTGVERDNPAPPVDIDDLLPMIRCPRRIVFNRLKLIGERSSNL